MTEPSLAQNGGTVHTCADCGRFVATLEAPGDLLRPARLICEACAEPGALWKQCEPIGPAPEKRAFVWVDVEFLELVAPLLGAVELRTYLAAVQLCDGSRALCSQAKLARTAGLSRRNVVDAVELLQRIGLLVRAGTYGARGSRYLVVRTAQIGGDPARPCLLRPGAYAEARRALSVIRGSPVEARSVICDHVTRDPGITDTSDLGITDSPSLYPTGIQQTNQLAGRFAHPPTPERRNGARAPCLIAEAAAEAAAASWPEYSRHVVTDRALRLVEWAEAAGEPATEAQIAKFLSDGAQQDWIRRGVARAKNPISSGLHVWCDRERWLFRLRESNRAAARHAERERAAVVRELPQSERVSLARRALAAVDSASREKRLG